jgi:hypothetical protein
MAIILKSLERANNQNHLDSVDTAMLGLTWHILQWKDRDFPCRLPLASRITTAGAAGIILRIMPGISAPGLQKWALPLLGNMS